MTSSSSTTATKYMETKEQLGVSSSQSVSSTVSTFSASTTEKKDINDSENFDFKLGEAIDKDIVKIEQEALKKFMESRKKYQTSDNSKIVIKQLTISG